MDLRKLFAMVVALTSGTITLGTMFFYTEPNYFHRKTTSVMFNFLKRIESVKIYKTNEHVTNDTDVKSFMQFPKTSYLSKSNYLSRARFGLSFNVSAVLNRFNFTDIIVNSEKECYNSKFIVYRCDYSRSCGGWADRQRGIITSFLLALLTGRAFVIDMNKPCQLEKVLKPHFYDWNICKSFVNSNKVNSSKLFDFIGGSPFFREIQSFDFDEKWKWKVVSLKINSDLIRLIRKHKKVKERLDWILHTTLPNTVNTVLHTLFQPTVDILNYLEHFNQRNVKGKSLVCSHIRTGRNPSNPKDNLFEEKPDKSIIFNFLKNYTEQSKYALYLATDANSVRQKFEKMFGNSIKMNVTIVHVDRLGKYRGFNKQACDGFKSALIEQYILSTCDILVLTDSGFGKNAACMRGNSDQLYFLDPKNNSVVPLNL